MSSMPPYVYIDRIGTHTVFLWADARWPLAQRWWAEAGGFGPRGERRTIQCAASSKREAFGAMRIALDVVTLRGPER